MIKIKIAICDDINEQAAFLENILLSICGKYLEIDVFSSGNALLKHLSKNNEKYNIYFLDIEMPEINGIKTAKHIRENDETAIIIFVTSHREYVYDVFECLPFRFLVKPYKENELQEIFWLATKHIKKSNQYFFFKKGHSQHQILFSDIEYFESCNRIITVFSKNAKEEFYGKISLLSNELDEIIFAKISSSCIVNLQNIYSVNDAEITMKSSKKIYISKRSKTEFNRKFLFYKKWQLSGGV